MSQRELNGPTVLFVRHGKTAFNQDTDSESRLKGTKYDLPLTDEGHEEAKKAAGVVSQYPVGSIRHSDMQRASQRHSTLNRRQARKALQTRGLILGTWGFSLVRRAKMLNEESSITSRIQASQFPKAKPTAIGITPMKTVSSAK